MARALATAFVNIVPGTKDFEKQLKKDLAGPGTEAAGKAGGNKFGAAFGKAVSGTFKAVGAAAGAAIAAGVASAVEIDKGLSEIRKATGATGADFEALGEVYRTVARQVPQSFGDVATAIGDINTRLGLTGDKLEETSRLLLDYARINNVDVAQATTNVGRLFNALQIDIDKLPGVLDKLTLAGQKTGISVDTLGKLIVDAGPAFEEMGFDLDRSIALFSQFEAAGANPQQVVSSLGRVLNNFARQGVTDANEAMDQLLHNIKEAPDILSATTIAADAFGSRVGAKVATDIRAGRFETDEFVAALSEAGGTLQDTAEESLTFGQKLSIMKNNVAIALEPLGEAILPAIEQALEVVTRNLDGLAEKMSEFFDAVAPVAEKLWDSMLPVLEELGQLFFEVVLPAVLELATKVSEWLLPALRVIIEFVRDVFIPGVIALFGWMKDNIAVVGTFVGVLGAFALAMKAGAIATGIMTIAKKALSLAFLVSPIGLIAVAVAALAAGIVWLATKTEFFQIIWEGVVNAAKAVWDAFVTGFQAAIQFIVNLWDSMTSGISRAWDSVTGALRKAWDGVVSFFTLMWEGFVLGFTTAINGIRKLFTTVVSGLLKIWTGMVDGIASAFGKVWDTVKKVFGFITNVFKASINVYISMVEGFVNRFIRGINLLIRGINNFFSFKVPDWVPLIGGNDFNLNIREVSSVSLPRLGDGGFVPGRPGGQPAIIGEAGPEVVIPLDRFEDMMGLDDRQPNIVYNAAPNESIDSERALITAVRRARVLAAW